MLRLFLLLQLLVQWMHTEFSPLRLLDKQIQIVQDDGTFELVMPFKNSTDFSVLVCFASTDLIIGLVEGQDDLYGCQLEPNQPYNCIRVEGQQGSSTDFQTLTKSIDLDSLNTTGFLSPINLQEPTIFEQGTGADNSSNTSSMEVTTYEIRLSLSSILSNDTIYHMVSCEDYQNGGCKDYWKLNYVHTYVNPQYASNLIVQRNHQCGVYFDDDDGGAKIFNHVFYGGTKRDNVDTMFFAILVQHEDDAGSLNMWGGIDYTNDHTNKDMFCFSNANGQSFDALSLLLGAPYKDIAANIEGEESTSIIGNSFYGVEPFSNFYFIQYYRNYDTGDFVGDDRLFPKIDDNFAYAAYFHSSRRNAVSCTNPSYKHQLLFPISIDLSLFGPCLYVAVCVAMILAI